MATDQLPARPALLQLNKRGSWMSVARFDAGDERAADAVMSASVLLSFVDGGAWRICTDEPMPLVLMRLESPAAGWQVVDGEGP